jgi:hypothetical protein
MGPLLPPSRTDVGHVFNDGELLEAAYGQDTDVEPKRLYSVLVSLGMASEPRSEGERKLTRLGAMTLPREASQVERKSGPSGDDWPMKR